MSKKLFLAAAAVCAVMPCVANASAPKSGFYVGGSLGMAIQQSQNKSEQGKKAFNGSRSKTTPRIEILAGWSTMFTDKFYGAVEAVIGHNFGSTKGTKPAILQHVFGPIVYATPAEVKGVSKTTLSLGLRGKLGYYITDSTSLYGLVGLNMSRHSHSWTMKDPITGETLSDRKSKTLLSPEIGVGFETDLGNNKDWKLFGQVSKVLGRKVNFKGDDMKAFNAKLAQNQVKDYNKENINASLVSSSKDVSVGEWRMLVGVKKFF